MSDCVQSAKEGVDITIVDHLLLKGLSNRQSGLNFKKKKAAFPEGKTANALLMWNYFRTAITTTPASVRTMLI